MKDKNKNTRIKLSKKEIKQGISSLDLWIKIDKEKFGGNPKDTIELLSKMRSISNKVDKEEYTINLNFKELVSLCDIVAEHCLYCGEDKIIGKQMCEKLETIIKSNYKSTLRELCYPTYRWEKYQFLKS